MYKRNVYDKIMIFNQISENEIDVMLKNYNAYHKHLTFTTAFKKEGNKNFLEPTINIRKI